MNGVGRDAIANGFFQKMAEEAEEAERLGLIRRSTKEEREVSWRQVLSENPNDCNSVWIFAYGSLIWNPAFHFTDQVDCRLFGYRRSFCLRTYMGRGSVTQPGMVLGLEKGGSCKGVALKVCPDQLEQELEVIWSRELISVAYIPKWVTLRTDKEPVKGIAFVMDVNANNFGGHMSFEEKCHDLAYGYGALGHAADYLYETHAALENIGIQDKMMRDLVHAVRQIRVSKGLE